MSKDLDSDLIEKDLGIEKDLIEKDNYLIKQRLQVLLPLALAIGIVGYMIYTTFFNKPVQKKKKEKAPITIRPKTFIAPPEPLKAIVKEEEKDLPMSPLEPSKPKHIPKVSKSSKGTIISFNKSVKKEIVPKNQIDVNIMNNPYRSTNQKKVTSKASSQKKVEMYRGGEYAIAGISRQNPNLSLAKGSYIECTMETRIVSSYSGNTKCITSEDTYSTNGVTLLIEKGSTVTGHFKGGSMENGVERLFIIWDEIRTPNNVVVNIDSHAIGELGATGVDGYIDNHWGTRFGAAVLVSILDISTNMLKNEYSQNNNNISLGSNSNAITSMSNTALNKFINIKPTFYKNHGDVVNIYIEKDLDFSKVYRLK